LKKRITPHKPDGALQSCSYFKTGALNHSATLPLQQYQSLSGRKIKNRHNKVGPDTFLETSALAFASRETGSPCWSQHQRRLCYETRLSTLRDVNCGFYCAKDEFTGDETLVSHLPDGGR
jgi:hypothetical protein